MMGVIIWSYAVARKAVVWCDDHGERSFLRPTYNLPEEKWTLDAGDLIEFDVKLQGNFRIVTTFVVIDGYATTNLASNLKLTKRASICTGIRNTTISRQAIAC